MKRLLWAVEVDAGDGRAVFETRDKARVGANIVRILQKTPARVVPYEPRRECVWVKTQYGAYKAECEGYYFPRAWKYCPRCGGMIVIKSS